MRGKTKVSRIAVPLKLYEIINELVENGEYSSSTEFITEAIRSHLNTWYPRLLRVSEGDLNRKLEELKDAKENISLKIRYEKDEQKKKFFILERYRLTGMIDAIYYTIRKIELTSSGEVKEI